MPNTFREEYCTLWRSLFVLDVKSIENIAHKWGIAVDANMSVPPSDLCLAYWY